MNQQSLNINSSQIQESEVSDYNQETSLRDPRSKITLRNTFISPELAYNNEKKKFFEKIGYNRKVAKPQEEKESLQEQSSMTVVNMKQSEVEPKFIRRRNKADDTFYEKRVNTLSKVRGTKKSQILDEGSVSSSSNVIKRLMTIRKQRQNHILNQCYNDESQNQLNSPGEYLTIVKNYKYNSRTEANATANGGPEPQLIDLNNSFYHQNDYLQEDSVNQDSQTLVNLEAGKVSTVTVTNFMGRRHQLRMSSQKPKAQQTVFIPNTTTGVMSNYQQRIKSKQEQSLDTRMVSRGASSFMIDQDEVNINDRSINTASTFRGNALGQFSKGLANKSLQRLNNFQFIPQIQGFAKQDLLDLYQAKCKDLLINPSKDQMMRFFEIVKRNQGDRPRKLHLVDMGLGDNSVQIISRIIKKNPNFSTLDLRKNFISNEGIKHLSKSLQANESLVHLNIGCNQVSTDGAVILFQALKNQKSIVSIHIGNTDCYKNKNKIGTKGAIVLGELLKQNQLLQILDITDCSISQEGLSYIISGLKQSPNLISVNLSQSDIGSSSSLFSQLLTIFNPSKHNSKFITMTNLEELILSQNQLSNKNIEDLASVLKNCEKTKLSRLDISFNKLTSKAFLSLIQALRNNQQLKLTHLTLDKSSFEPGSQQESQINYHHLLRQLTEYLSHSKSSLQYLSLNNCNVRNDMVNAIGRGLLCNDKIETLLLRGNNIEDEGLYEIMETFYNNKNLKLKTIDLSSNRINDVTGPKLANAIAQAEQLQQVFLKDNHFGNDSGDAFLFLVQSKKNLCKLQLDMNVIKYVTLIEIEKHCKKNKGFAQQMNIPEIQQEINLYMEKRDPKVNLQELDSQIKYQSKQIQEGQKLVVNEEEEVQQIINEGQQHIKQFDQKKKTLQNIIDKQDELLHEIDLQYQAKEKEYLKKIEQEQSLLDRCRDYTNQQELKLKQEKAKIQKRREVQQADEEEIKLKQEMERIKKEHEMMLIIIDNYEKEIERIKKRQETQAHNNHQEHHQESKPTLLGMTHHKQMSMLDEKESFLIKKKRKTSKKRVEGKNPPNKKKIQSEKKVKMVANLMCHQHQNSGMDILQECV